MTYRDFHTMVNEVVDGKASAVADEISRTGEVYITDSWSVCAADDPMARYRLTVDRRSKEIISEPLLPFHESDNSL